MSDNLEKFIGLVQPTAISSYTPMDYWCGKLFPAPWRAGGASRHWPRLTGQVRGSGRRPGCRGGRHPAARSWRRRAQRGLALVVSACVPTRPPGGTPGSTAGRMPAATGGRGQMLPRTGESGLALTRTHRMAGRGRVKLVIFLANSVTRCRAPSSWAGVRFPANWDSTWSAAGASGGEPAATRVNQA